MTKIRQDVRGVRLVGWSLWGGDDEADDGDEDDEHDDDINMIITEGMVMMPGWHNLWGYR